MGRGRYLDKEGVVKVRVIQNTSSGVRSVIFYNSRSGGKA